jgi:(p)ppGpp synthase/HD superfamily hydrolase
MCYIQVNGNEHKVTTFNNREVYLVEDIYYDCETHLVAGTSTKHFPLLRMAKALSIRAYENQVRRTTGLPYVDHCTEIYRLCGHYKFSHGDDVMYAAAVLHDYLEDAVKRGSDQDETISWLQQTFGYSVSTIIQELTNDEKNERGLYPLKSKRGDIEWVEKSEYINWKLGQMSSKALFCKLLDMLSNLVDSETLPKFVKRIRKQINYIDENIGTVFKHKLSTDHLLVIADIQRVLKEIYNE